MLLAFCKTATEGLLKAGEQFPPPLDIPLQPHDVIMGESIRVLQTDSVVVDQFLGDLDVSTNEGAQIGAPRLVHGGSFLLAGRERHHDRQEPHDHA
ncbi:MAG: hypothetical protein HZB45_11040 [Mycolicibacterium rufum]|uniref:hypothetical protein n=1 Tax=Mycolicibacterium chlorophenolicum TaxID=37916 RepID=UPI00103896CD|nr:hypothetical protein [Mycolicibacterium chlorophenolicum]MBI5338203.1 hypothetical protein [Mycolicibacterium rufum]